MHYHGCYWWPVILLGKYLARFIQQDIKKDYMLSVDISDLEGFENKNIKMTYSRISLTQTPREGQQILPT